MPVATLPKLIDVTTTTVFASSSATPTVSNDNRSSSVPVAAIAGGVTAGALLAVALVIGWIVWGRSIKRQKAKEQREAVSLVRCHVYRMAQKNFLQDDLRITKQNTMKNASTFSKPRDYSYRPLFWPPSDTQVRFAAPDGSEKNTSTTHATRKTPSRPKPLTPRVSFVPNNTTTTPAPATEPISHSQRRTISSPPPALITPQSSAPDPDSAGLTTDESRSQSSLLALVSALGASAHRLSSASSWSRLTGNRVSQATSGSSYSQPSNRSTISVGRAY
ncbi:hypothetical protein F5878DRAFT_68367 [Lentinula raphanica]|uniref:Uncharacterized protein n=1 Tax=Lentinula raphanica TaxID=153919 RepID=A0AA38PDA9_9AGAR|nr:hypothetical protein F5878DRAFT_68367 [Lentinula raphanica]